jgi:CBS domain-containing protein
MKVRELMTKTAVFCRPETNLAAAGALMWENDCGALPVVSDGRKVTGILTDRDICIALTTRDRLSSQLTAGEVAAKQAIVCKPDDEILAAITSMHNEKIRRLPVVNDEGSLEGIVSMDDIVLQAKKGNGKKKPDVSYGEVVETLQAIYENRRARSRPEAA